MRSLLILFVIALSTNAVFADISGEGCKISSGYVYTQYLGTVPAYKGTAPIRYFNSNGPKIPIYWGYGQNPNRGYRCGYINKYPASSYYDSESGQNIPIPAENEFTFLGPQCVIAPALGASPVATDSYVSYSYMKTSNCSANVPIDDYILFLLILVAIISTFLIREKFSCMQG